MADSHVLASRDDLAAVVSSTPRHTPGRLEVIRFSTGPRAAFVPFLPDREADGGPFALIPVGIGDYPVLWLIGQPDQREALRVDAARAALCWNSHDELTAGRDALKAKIELAVMLLKGGRSNQDVLFTLCEPMA